MCGIGALTALKTKTSKGMYYLFKSSLLFSYTQHKWLKQDRTQFADIKSVRSQMSE